MKYSYQAEKFSTARSCLMLPHARGEATSIAGAFHECSLGLHDLDEKGLMDSVLHDDAKALIRELRKIMSTEGLKDPNKVGLYTVKAESLSYEERLRLSHIIDELNFWFRESD